MSIINGLNKGIFFHVSVKMAFTNKDVFEPRAVDE